MRENPEIEAFVGITLETDIQIWTPHACQCEKLKKVKLDFSPLALSLSYKIPRSSAGFLIESLS